MANPKGPAKLIPRSVRMTAEEHEQIDRIAQKLGKTPAELMRDTFREIIQDSGGRSASTWQPIETAPRDGTEIIVWDDGRPEFAHWEPSTLYTAGGSWRGRTGFYVFLPSLWMPLPEEP